MQNSDDGACARAIVTALAEQAVGPLAMLDALAAAFGTVPEAAVAPLAEAIGVDRFEARAIMLFHRDFRADPGRRHMVRPCRAERCRQRGGWEIADRIAAALGIGWYETTADGRVTLEPAYCLGLCDHGPSAAIDDEVAMRLDRIGAEALVARVTGRDGSTGA